MSSAGLLEFHNEWIASRDTWTSGPFASEEPSLRKTLIIGRIAFAYIPTTAVGSVGPDGLRPFEVNNSIGI